MAYQGETPSSAIVAAPAAVHRRTRLVLLFSEQSRPIACAVETALVARGWDVSIEFGIHDRPWIPPVPPSGPSLRILCVAGRVDPAYVHHLRMTLWPDAHADLHILGLDDSRSLVHDIERLAGVRQPSRRSLFARPRLHHPTQTEATVERERHWLLGTTAAVASFAITLGGIAMAQVGAPPPPPAMATNAAATAAPVYTPLEATRPSVAPPLDAAVLSAISPFSPPEDDEWIPEEEEEEEDDLIILDDKPPAEVTLRVVEVTAPPLVDPAIDVAPTERLELGEPSPTPLADLPREDAPLPNSAIAPAVPRLQLPAGFLPVAGLSVADGEGPTAAGRSALPSARRRSTGTDDPFITVLAVPTVPTVPAVPAAPTVPAKRTTVDPFAELSVAEPSPPAETPPAGPSSTTEPPPAGS